MTSPSTGLRPWGAGMVIGGRYRILHRIGAGAMGEVWRAEHVTLGTHVAIKLVDVAAHGTESETLARFLHEARAAAQLKSPHVVQILDHGAQGRVAYIAMELLEGDSLGERLEQRRALPPADVARIVTEMARAMGRAHELGIVHRDLKPENVFLARTDAGEVAKILDFGIAKSIAPTPDALVKTREGMMVGTPAYMSPEQVLGTTPLDWRSDLWQMAMITFECVCGQRAFDGQSLGELFMKICAGPIPVPSSVARVPDGFDAWFARAARRAPAERFGSAAELATSLCAVLAPGVGADISARIPAFHAPGSGAYPVVLPGARESARTPWPAGRAPLAGTAGRSAVRRGLSIAALAAVPLGVAALVALLARDRLTVAPAPPAAPVSVATSAAAPEPQQPAASASAVVAPAPSGATPNEARADGGAPARKPRPARPEDVLGI